MPDEAMSPPGRGPSPIGWADRGPMSETPPPIEVSFLSEYTGIKLALRSTYSKKVCPEEIMSCLSLLVHGQNGRAWACTYQWVTNEKIYPYFGAYVTAFFIFITFIQTYKLTRALKRTDTFVAFSNTFNDYMKEKETLRHACTVAARLAADTTERAAVEVAQPGAAELERRVLDFYGRFYALIFSEFYLYKTGSLDRILFTLWMRSRWREFRAPKSGDNLLHNRSYEDGWSHWLKHFHRDATDDFTRFMKDIRGCTFEHRVPGLVRKHGPTSQWLLSRIQFPFVEAGYWVPRGGAWLGGVVRSG